MDVRLSGSCLTVSTNDLSIPVPFIVAPNPANQFIQISLPTAAQFQNGQLYLMNVFGQSLRTIPIAEEVNVSIVDYPNGLYLIGLEMEGKMLYKKLVISN